MSTLHAVAPAPIDSLEGRRLTLLLHGFGANEQDLLPLAPALGDAAVISLRAPVTYGPGFSWSALDPDGTPARAGGLHASAEAVLEWLDALPGTALGAPTAVRLLGFSQGGALALTLLRHAPARFERIVVLAGFVPDEPGPADEQLAAERSVPVLWGRGDADAVIAADAVARTAAWLPAHTAATIRTYPGLAHGISAEELEDVAAFLR